MPVLKNVAMAYAGIAMTCEREHRRAVEIRQLWKLDINRIGGVGLAVKGRILGNEELDVRADSRGPPDVTLKEGRHGRRNPAREERRKPGTNGDEENANANKEKNDELGNCQEKPNDNGPARLQRR